MKRRSPPRCSISCAQGLFSPCWALLSYYLGVFSSQIKHPGLLRWVSSESPPAHPLLSKSTSMISVMGLCPRAPLQLGSICEGEKKVLLPSRIQNSEFMYFFILAVTCFKGLEDDPLSWPELGKPLACIAYVGPARPAWAVGVTGTVHSEAGTESVNREKPWAGFRCH